MTWKVNHLNKSVASLENYRYNFEFWDYNVYDKAKAAGKHLQAALKYQGWAMGGCSTAQCWGWIHIPKAACTKEHLVGFIDALKSVAAGSCYDPKMFFAQLPAEGREGFSSEFWKFLLAEICPDLQPVFTYENRAHASTLQRLYYVDTVPLYKYAEKYHAEQKLLQSQPPVGSSNDGNRTIITGAGGIKPPEYDQYFDASR